MERVKRKVDDEIEVDGDDEEGSRPCGCLAGGVGGKGQWRGVRGEQDIRGVDGVEGRWTRANIPSRDMYGQEDRRKEVNRIWMPWKWPLRLPGNGIGGFTLAGAGGSVGLREKRGYRQDEENQQAHLQFRIHSSVKASWGDRGSKNKQASGNMLTHVALALESEWSHDTW